jgi:predicted MFS family arabinose efflux permease
MGSSADADGRPREDALGMTATSPTLGDRLLTAPFVLLTLGELAYFVADGMTVFLVPVHATGPLGADRGGAGLAFGVFAVSALLLRPIAGRLCDTRGRRPLLVGGAATATIALLLTAAANGLGDLLALRLLAGVAEAAVFVASFAAVADLAPPGRMGEAISYNSLALYVGLAGGPPLAEYLVESAPFSGFGTAWTGAALLAAAAGVVFLGVGETRPPHVRDAAKDAPLPPLVHWGSLPVSLGFLTSVVAMAGFLAFAALHAEGVGMENASVPLTVYGVVVVLGRIAFAKVPDRMPGLALAAGALTAIAAGMIAMAIWSSPLGLICGTALLALGVTFTTPAFFAAVFSIVPDSERGSASATMSACIDIGFGAGPILLGLVAQHSGIPWAMATGALVVALGALWTIGPAARLVAKTTTSS